MSPLCPTKQNSKQGIQVEVCDPLLASFFFINWLLMCFFLEFSQSFSANFLLFFEVAWHQRMNSCTLASIQAQGVSLRFCYFLGSFSFSIEFLYLHHIFNLSDDIWNQMHELMLFVLNSWPWAWWAIFVSFLSVSLLKSNLWLVSAQWCHLFVTSCFQYLSCLICVLRNGLSFREWDISALDKLSLSTGFAQVWKFNWFYIQHLWTMNMPHFLIERWRKKVSIIKVFSFPSFPRKN